MSTHSCPPRAGVDPCSPSRKAAECSSCARYQPHHPDDAEERPYTVLLDASIARRVPVGASIAKTRMRCAMFERATR